MDNFDVIVIGGGHAGVEASFACAKMGMKTLLCTLNKKMIANLPCNPHIGGSAKGIVVREIDALGGLMGIAADKRPLQMKMLNTGKGPGVQCLRSQQDKKGYPSIVQDILDNTKNLSILETEIVDLICKTNEICGVISAKGERINSKATIITTGTYMNGRIITGRDEHPGGPDGENPSIGLSESLNRLGIETWRLKTGTPPRLDKKTIDFSKGLIQEGTDDHYSFSYETTSFVSKEEQLPCYLIYTTDQTIQIIKDHLKDSALFDGRINSNGPRYCPSIESKVVRFSDKPRHQLFLEPEFEDGDSIYLQGFSTAMPIEVQEKMVHSLPGLENATILKWAYQIEYDAIKPLQFDASLAIRKYKGLYGAGQILGTSGYEEAGGLGLLAGINASLYIKGEKPFILRRDESYIGVMIDDLVTKGTDEPYRLMSSRAEYRLLLRHDNADFRLTSYGHKLGLISQERYNAFLEKYKRIDEAIKILLTTNISDKEGLNSYFVEMGFPKTDVGFKGIDILKRPHFTYRRIRELMPELKDYEFSDEDLLALETKVKYEGYIEKELRQASSLKKEETFELSPDIDYLHMDGLRLEARSKLDNVRPLTLGQASRIPGVNPADVAVLLLNLKKRKSK